MVVLLHRSDHILSFFSLSSSLPLQAAMDCYHVCTQLFNALDMPFRVYCKKGCTGDADTIEECEEECKKLCYKDPVYKEYEWTKPLDRSPGSRKYSERCDTACKKGCLFKLEKAEETCIVEPPKSPKV